MKKWIWVLIAIVSTFLVLLGLVFVRSMFAVSHYGAPLYRPKVE